MNLDNRPLISSELVKLINKSNAHVSLEEALADLPIPLRTVIPDGLPYSIWQLVEHMRITQKDIVEFSLSDSYKPIVWPDDYWTANPDEVGDEEWANALKEIEKDRDIFFGLLENEERDLFSPFEWGEGQNLFREAVLIADHNAYHTAEIVVIRKITQMLEMTVSYKSVEFYHK